MKSNAALHLCLLLALAAVLFSVNLGGYDLWPADEPRYAEVAREMMVSGDYVVPTVNGETYFEKPPLLFWSQALLSLPGGEVTEWTARLPSVLSALFVLVLTWLLARKLFDDSTAFWSVLILLTMQRFWWQARTGQIDMLLTACMMLSLYAFWNWELSRRRGWLALLYGGMALGLLAKGPPALVFPLLCIVAYHWRNRLGRKQTHWVLGTLAALAIMALWFVPARMMAAGTAEDLAQGGMAGNIFRNTIGRMVLGVSKADWPWMYLETIPVDVLPWALLLPWTLPWIWRTRNSSASHRLLWCWTVPALIFFSISIGKRAIYILPLFPVFAIYIAASLSSFDQASERAKKIVVRLLAGVFGLLGVLVLAAPALVKDYDVSGAEPLALFLAAGVAVLLLANRLPVARPQVAAIAIAMSTLYVGAAFVVLPVANRFKGSAALCQPLRDLSEAGTEYRLYAVGFSREEYMFYAEKYHTPILTDLVGRASIPPDDLMKTAMLQRDAKHLLQKAVDKVPVTSWEHVTEAEREALETAARNALHESDLDPAMLQTFEAQLQQEIDAYATEFLGGSPAFMFVQNEDWPWLIALCPQLNQTRFIHGDAVGRRDVLLLSNEAGAALVPPRESTGG